MNFYKTIYSFIALYRSRTYNLILALFCCLLFASDSYAQTNQPTGYGGISGFVEYEVNDVAFLNTPFTENQLGGSVVNMGDIDGDGIDDLAVGMPQLTPITNLVSSGGVYILLMNADNTFKFHPNPFRIAHSNDAAGIQLPSQTQFGISVANIGDFDGNGINELAVGTLKGKIYILHLKPSGELDRFSTIDVNDLNIILDDDDSIISNPNTFGISVANLGDIDGDGVIDLAVGAHRGDGEKGSVHILFMDKTETGPTLKAAVKLDTTAANLVNGDVFGISVANLGDLNQDGINDLAVGAIGDDGLVNDANDAGTVHIFYLNRDGSVKPGGFKIFDDAFKAGDAAGRSIANLGDLNGDGINDIAVGAISADTPGTNDNTGAVFTIFMGKINDFFRIDNTSHPDLDLSNYNFGQAIANIGDRNGDGINDLAVGAPEAPSDFGGLKEGILYILYMDANTNIVNITSSAENGSYNTGTIDIQVIFSEAVTVDATGGTPTLTLETGSIDTPATYTMGSESTVLTFVYTVVADDLADDLDYVSSASLTLNGGTINATDAPNSTALLTLPEPGTRGSLSSNKNISINTAAITNTAPERDLTIPIPAQELTANTTFAYTIPTGAFTDAQNDPLTYSASGLPGWLTLDTYTGIFSGTPVTQRALTQYTYTVSDGTLEIEDTISITVNAALTLPAIADRNYSPDSGQTFTIQLPTADGGTGDITYTLSPVLANELTFSTSAETNEITVRPTAEEKTRTYTYTAEDQNGALAAQIFTITIKLPELPNISDKIYSLGNTINEILPAAIGEPEAVTYTLTPTSTNGLTFADATRTISGIPERLSKTEYIYTAEDSAIPVNTVSTNFFITIIAATTSSFSARGNSLISDIIKYDRLTVPGISIGTAFGSSVADLGDIDKDGIDDLAVGAPLDDSGGNDRGAVYILFMNADNTIKANTKIIHGSAGIELINNANFGISVANIGDFDKNEINELAVGTLKGEIYILHLTDSGEIERFSTIDVDDVNDPIPVTNSDAELGSSIANLGDIDGDGVDDLAVGSIRDGSGGMNRGAVHILFMDESGLTKKANAKIRNSNVTLTDFDAFGSSIAKLGDLDGDGINDMAVGAIGTDKSSVNTNEGAVHVLLLNRDGSIKPTSFEIVDTDDDNIFNPDSQDFTGSSIANLGDINGDGINDIAVGARGSNNTKEGSVFTILMRNAGDDLITTNGFFRIDTNSHSDLNLSNGDRFGTSIANIGDRNGDGINDLAVGAPSDDSGGTDSGALYILYMDAETVIRGVTAAEENGSYNTNATINIQVIFSEAVDVDATGGTPTLTLKTKDTDPEMNTDVLYVGGSGSDTLTFEYTVVADDEATDLDYVSTASLMLNSGTINAATTPNNAAVLTLPEPGTRGSLSSNKNISINTAAPLNTEPTRDLTIPIPAQVLTANTSFIYTIPAGAFTDADNDPLTYSSSELPNGLTLDATGTFSGTPVTEQTSTQQYTFLVSDGTASTNSTIGIKVNAALTLETIADRNYSPGDPITPVIELPDAIGGTKPIKYTLSPTLIDGLITFDAGERTIAGTAPTTEQRRQYTYTAEDANGALAAQTFTIIIIEPPIIKVEPARLSLVEMPGGDSTQISVSLSRIDVDEVTVNIAATGGLSVSPLSLTFNNTKSQPVTVTATNDNVYMDDRSAMLTLTATDYVMATVMVEITEDEPQSIIENEPTGYGGISDVVKLDRFFSITETEFGNSVANMGDIDGDGIDDLAVGAHELSQGTNTALSFLGGVVILLMNADNTVKFEVRIPDSNDAAAGLQLTREESFGISVANIGDFDGDGINELAVGRLRKLGGTIYILHLKRSGALDRFSTIDVNDLNNILDSDDSIISNPNTFGVSIANLGDIDGDGVIDLAVGAHRGDGNKGSVHILFMDKTETGPTLKAAVKLDTTGVNLANDDAFGISVANLGDLNQDGINDLAVGAINDDGQANNAGTVHIFYLNRDGSVKGGFEIFDDAFIAGDAAGRSIANLGDLNGDGINDIAVGAIGADSDSDPSPINDTGAVFTIFMGKTRDQITTNDFFRIDTNSHSALNNLRTGDRFGESVANIGDRNGDGINDLAVGAPGTRAPSPKEGVLYILYMDANTNIVNITSSAENGSYNTGTIDIQVIFSEAVTVDATGGIPTLTLETGNIDTTALYTMGSESTVLTFVYTVATSDRATDLDYASSASLTLNGGTINATDVPNSTALLTLPKPGTRGSLSSNKNIAINTAAITNTPPTRELTIPIPAQELTANTTFAYTIPTGAFTDAENDPLTYSASELPGLELPNWLKLDTYTGIFSGTPVTEQALTQYTYTVSDGTLEIEDMIGITVNKALTLETIADRNYSPDSGQTFTIRLPTATGGTGAITYTLSPVLADELIFDTATRRIMVTPTAEEKMRTYTYTAEDRNGALAAQTFTITIKPLELPNISDKRYSLGNTINEILPAAIGGTEEITYTLTPTPADGLTFSTATRAISGIPEKPSRTEYTYTAEDSAISVNTVSTNFFITIIADAISPFPAKGNGLISDVVKYDRLTVPGISIGTAFGSSVADMGDIDRNGTDDLAVGAPLDDSGGSNRGAVYILLMNADNTIKDNTKIIHGSAGIDLAGIDLIDDSNFGTSVANIGDFDGNGINELAVGTLKGEIYILRLTRSGEIERFSTIDVDDVNDPITVVGDEDGFGVSIANIGDIDGDRVDDLAVGAIRDNTRGTSSGAIHILFMNESGLTKKATNARINSLNDNLTLNAFDAFGSSIARLGDLDGDGINDIAVGAIGDDKSSGNTNEGVVHVLLLNRDGSIKPTSFEIVDTDDDNIFNPDTQDFTGRSIANLGDINGDGINDIAVGAPGNNNAKEGSVFTILMRNAGDDLITTNGFLRTADNSHPDLDLSASDRFGTSIANIGDRNGDGVNDLAVGAPSDDSGGTDSGALYILHMDTETVIRAVTAAEENGRYEDGDTINIQVIFSEAVDVDATGGTPTLTLETRTGDNDTDAVYDSGSGSDTLTFEYTVVNGDEATDLDYVSTASLTLSDGTINAAAAPNSAALLTLPKPGTRGSLSSNKNISINRMAIENTRPRKIQTQPIPDQELTVNTPFTYTIPAGRFTDDQNDPLTYLPSTSLPDGLTLDARTGTFSGTPVTEQALIPYDYTVSDGTVSITDTINIIVNAAPTLSTMADKIYPPNSSVFLPTTLPSPSGGAKPITYTLSPELPDGLTFDDETRMITGITPATEQTGQYTYTAEDKNGALTVQKFTISIKPLILNQFYTVNIPITNLTLPEVPGGAAETGPYTYTLTPASFPEGLSYDEGTRTISGTPVEAPQTTRYTYTITNPAGTIVSVNFIITIIAETITTGYGGISNVARLNRNFTFTETQFGSSVANMGDINGDGIDDLAVGAQGLSLNIDTLSRLGSVVILLMNANNTIKSDVRITHSNDEAGFQLPENGSFGISVANIGDFDGDKINELAVGTTNEKMYILHLTSSGHLDSFFTIDFNDINTILGNTDLDSDDRFGVSVANLGDIDGDGVIDLAVGAHRDDGTRGSVHILFMDKTETNRPILKAAVKLDTTDANLVNGDLFGISVANLGDLNQDGINDLAVGATNDNGQANNAGTVHIFYLNRDGSVKLGGFEIFDNVFKAEDKVGRSIANLGDINGDGINDIVVGATEVDSPPTDNTGAVFTIFMGRTRDQITTNDFFRIDTDSLGLNLSDGDRFGESIANIGDRNGDGINDLAVGAPGTRRGNFASEGTFYILYMDANTNIVNITSSAANESYSDGDIIDIQIIFSETVTVDATGGTPTLTLETRTGDNDTDAVYDGGSGSTTLTFTYMVLADDSATDLDYVNTASLTLNGGTINATDAPNSTALLTLPKPGTRGSLSSNKNIAINEPLPTNREPAIGQPIPAQVLTANTSFIYTIPTGAFTDADNDPLIYFFTSSQSPPTWLTLDADTGTFSGALR